MKKLFSLVAAALLLAGLLPTSARAGLEAFAYDAAYSPGQFTDVEAQAWYAGNVAAAVRLGLMNGVSGTRFDPGGAITVGQAITMASRLHSIYHNGDAAFVQGEPWYRVYVDYALNNRIITGEYANYNRAATRAEYALILASALPAEALPPVNIIEPGAIPDVGLDSVYSAPIYALYRAGVLTGNDAAGTFTPETTIERSAAAAILTRMADPSLRHSLTLSAGPRTGLYEDAVNATFYLESYDYEGRLLTSGSGFFLEPSGIAVTSYQLVKEAFYAFAVTADEEARKVLGVLAYDADLDVALLRIEGSGFSVLTPGSPASLEEGGAVYTVGNPFDSRDNLSQGVVSGGVTDHSIRHTAVSQKGGALLDSGGRVVGVCTLPAGDNTTTGVAVPIDAVLALERGALLSLAQVAAQEAMRQYQSRYGLFEHQVYESGSHSSRETAMTLPMGHTLLGTLTDAREDYYRACCLTGGKLVVYAVTDATGSYFDDLVLAVEDASSAYGYTFGKRATLNGQNILTAEIEVKEASDVSIALFSNEMALSGSVYLEYALYWVLIPPGM